MQFDFKQILSVTLILFSVIDIIGSVPVVIDLRKKTGKIHSEKATIVAGALMILFLFLGQSILELFGLNIESFAIAGGIIMFIIAIEMILGVKLFKYNPEEVDGASIVPIAFPLIAGAGTLTTILTLRVEFATANIIAGIIINLIFVYIVLKTSSWLERKIGASGFGILRRVFGIILLSIAVKLILTNIAGL
ncbi:MAG: MarC family protein [Cyclobacteriaceae bacterium]|nr:MarC family protein [Cyclobacteriaceae bacterium]